MERNFLRRLEARFLHHELKKRQTELCFPGEDMNGHDIFTRPIDRIPQDQEIVLFINERNTEKSPKV